MSRGSRSQASGLGFTSDELSLIARTLQPPGSNSGSTGGVSVPVGGVLGLLDESREVEASSVCGRRSKTKVQQAPRRQESTVSSGSGGSAAGSGNGTPLEASGPAAAPVPSEEVPRYLARYGYAALNDVHWRVLQLKFAGGAVLPELGGPRLQLAVLGHMERGGHTWYTVNCALVAPGMLKCRLRWRVLRRLTHLREGLHSPVKTWLGQAVYDRHFGGSLFAMRGGPRGTTARLNGWCAVLAEVVNEGVCKPGMVAFILRFLGAPGPRLADYLLAAVQGRRIAAEPDGYAGLATHAITHRHSGIVVANPPLRLSEAVEGTVLLFHYTHRLAFEAMQLSQSCPETLQRTLMNPKYGAFGEGIYATAKAPDEFGNQQAVLVNNFSNAEDEALQNREVQEFAEFAAYCVPLLVRRSFAIEVMQEPLPEASMAQAGFDARGQRIRADRDVWVIRPLQARAHSEGDSVLVPTQARPRSACSTAVIPEQGHEQTLRTHHGATQEHEQTLPAHPGAKQEQQQDPISEGLWPVSPPAPASSSHSTQEPTEQLQPQLVDSLRPPPVSPARPLSVDSGLRCGPATPSDGAFRRPRSLGPCAAWSHPQQEEPSTAALGSWSRSPPTSERPAPKRQPEVSGKLPPPLPPLPPRPGASDAAALGCPWQRQQPARPFSADGVPHHSHAEDHTLSADGGAGGSSSSSTTTTTTSIGPQSLRLPKAAQMGAEDPAALAAPCVRSPSLPDLPRTPLARGILSPLPSQLPAELRRKRASSRGLGAGSTDSSRAGDPTETEAATEEQRVALDISDSQRWFEDRGQEDAPQMRQTHSVVRASSVPVLEQSGHPLQVHRPPALGEEVETDLPRHATSGVRSTPKSWTNGGQPAFASAPAADADSDMDDRRSRLLSFASNLIEAGPPPPTSLATLRPEAALPEPTTHAQAANADEASSGVPSPTPAPGAWSLSLPSPQEPQSAPAAPACSVAENELAALAARLEATPSEDSAALVEVLEELGRLHVTADLLRELRLGLLTRGLVEHPDRTVRTSVRRLRTSWKKLVHQLATGAGSSGTGGAESGVANGGA